MNYTVLKVSEENLLKKIFKLQVRNRDGLILNIHHTLKKKNLRFCYGCFQPNGCIFAIADQEGHVYLIDFVVGKYWGLPKLDSCSFIKFSKLNKSQLLAAKKEGPIYIVDVETGGVVGRLFGHSRSVTIISFSEKNLCLSAAQSEAIIWDLKTNTKLQVLDLEKGCLIKFIFFIPISNHILACFQDDIIQIWKNETYQPFKQFLPDNWNGQVVKCVTFSKNGRIMVVSGSSPVIAIFLADVWKLWKLVTLREDIQTIRKLAFVPHVFDGGCNKYLAILSGRGVIYVIDIEDNVIISRISTTCEIIRFDISDTGSHVICLLHSGNVELYDLSHYITKVVNVTNDKVKHIGKVKLRLCSKKYVDDLKEQMNDILDKDKLKILLMEYGEFPEIYRPKIWEILLQLPNNTVPYNSIINHTTFLAFSDLFLHFPVEDKPIIYGLKKLLNNLATWCPFFATVEYLPLFCFPFVQLFRNKPVICFELICTILMNWCQHWFEYYPLPPVNIMAMTENLLMEHDPDLLHFFQTKHVTSNVYAWLMLETAFSEVLCARDWLPFWDHVLLNEPSFLLCAVVGYNNINRKTLFNLSVEDEFELFFHSHTPIDIKKLIHKTYYILENTSENMHPRQYLDNFKPIDVGMYPQFLKYPKAALEFHETKKKIYDDEWKSMKDIEEEIRSECDKEDKEREELEIKDVERDRQLKVEEACMEKLKSYQEDIKQQHEKLKEMRQQLIKEEKGLLDYSTKKIQEYKSREKQATFSNILNSIEIGKGAAVNEVFKVEQHLQTRYLQMLKCRKKLNELLIGDVVPPDNKEWTVAQTQNDNSSEELKKTLKYTDKLKKINLAVGLSLMDKLINQIEHQLSRETSSTDIPSVSTDKTQVTALQAETAALEKEVSKLLEFLVARKAGIVSSTSVIPEQNPESSQSGILWSNPVSSSHSSQ